MTKQLEELAVQLVRHVEALDQQLVDWSGSHASIEADHYYLSNGSVWISGQYAVNAGIPRDTSPGELRRLIADCLAIAERLVPLIADAASVAGQNEQRARELLA